MVQKSFRINLEDWKAFRVQAKQMGLNSSLVIRQLISMFIQGKIKLSFDDK